MELSTVHVLYLLLGQLFLNLENHTCKKKKKKKKKAQLSPLLTYLQYLVSES